ncbi:MAG: hypothetical protein ISS92_02580 [Candidatus Omnitrophica bacterium]|nr:hypothetical protein [Candidatus Omnitrophota bacterium]
MFTRINIPGIIILVIVLCAIQLGVGYFLSPALKTVIVKTINERTSAKIELDVARIWPLTLSCSVNGLKIYDKAGRENLANIGNASLRLSPWALLSKRVVLSKVSVKNAEVFLKKRPDGSFNIEQIGQSREEAGKPFYTAALDRFKGKKDWFSIVYSTLQKVSSKKATEKKNEERKEEKKVTREVTELPRGKIVRFKTVRDDYLFEIRSLSIKNAMIHMEASPSNDVDIKKASIRLQKVVMDPLKGARFDGFSASGSLKKGKKKAGSFSLKYAQKYGRGSLKTEFNFSGKNIDMAALSFIYRDSLPAVTIKKGILSLSSKTDITNGKLNSRNSLSLRNQEVEAKSPRQNIFDQFGGSFIAAALNKIDPFNIKFKIGGTIESPEFSGFQESFKKIVTPYIEDLKAQAVSSTKNFIKEKVRDAMGGTTQDNGKNASEKAQEAVDSIKSFFQSKEPK